MVLEEHKVHACHGIDPVSVFGDAPLCTGLLRDAFESGEPLLIGDARQSEAGSSDSLSLLLSGIRSVMLVPYRSPDGAVAGLLYADSRVRSGQFNRSDLELAGMMARRLEAIVYKDDRQPFTAGLPVPALVSSPTTESPSQVGPRLARKARPSTTEAVRPAGAPLDAAAVGKLRPRTADLVIFFRTLATCLDANLGIVTALNLLSQQSPSPALAKINTFLSHSVQSGNYLSEGMRQCTGAFSKTQVALIRTGERSGTLHRLSNKMASYEERCYKARTKLVHSLTYPAITLALCLLLIVIVPPYVLEAQFQMLRSFGHPLPWLTRGLMAVSDGLRSWKLGLFLAMLAMLARGVYQAFKDPVASRKIWPYLLLLPGLGKVLRLYSAARLCDSLGMLLQVGHPILEALPLAVQAAQNPLWASRCHAAVEVLREGSTLSESLDALGSLPSGMTRILAATDECGKPADILAWLAALYQRDFEAAIEALVVLVEPLIMLGMGIVVGIMVLGTRLPMVQVIESL